MRTIRLLLTWLAFAGAVAAAESLTPFAEQLVGRWESISFVTTNCLVATNNSEVITNRDLLSMGLENRWESASLVATDYTRQTNLILCIYEVFGEAMDGTTRKRSAWLDTELHFTDHAGKERPIPEASGHAYLREHHIEFHAMYGYNFAFSITNRVMMLEKLGLFAYGGAYYKVYVKAALKRTNSEPGERLCIWRAEQGSAANRSQPVRPETNLTSGAAGSAR